MKFIFGAVGALLGMLMGGLLAGFIGLVAGVALAVALKKNEPSTGARPSPAAQAPTVPVELRVARLEQEVAALRAQVARLSR